MVWRHWRLDEGHALCTFRSPRKAAPPCNSLMHATPRQLTPDAMLLLLLLQMLLAAPCFLLLLPLMLLLLLLECGERGVGGGAADTSLRKWHTGPKARPNAALAPHCSLLLQWCCWWGLLRQACGGSGPHTGDAVDAQRAALPACAHTRGVALLRGSPHTPL